MRVIKKLLIALAVLAVLAGGVFGAVQYKKLRDENKKLSNPQEASKAETDRIVGQVGQLAVLPEGESPTVATVVDASKLKSQAFFAKAENGDKVLMYTKAKKAYLYRPSSNKILEIAPINLGANEKEDAAESDEQKSE